MPTFEIEVKTFRVEYKCDKCGEGVMRPKGFHMLLTDPPQFNHECVNCGQEQIFNERYPLFVTRPVDS